MEIKLEISEDVECTSSPWWMIIDPQQNLSKGQQGVISIGMGMITGPFFSREESEYVLESRRYRFGKNAGVFCASGCDTIQYREAYRKAEEAKRREKDGQ